jgi:transcription elongation factor GreB
VGEPNYISPVGLERIRREIDHLQKSERPRIVREVAFAASLGDRSENAEYIYGKKRLREIDSRLHFLIGRLDNIVVIDPAAGKGKAIRFGATVVIEDESGEQRTWRIYGEDEVDLERGILSCRSPIARALMGKSVGDTVKFDAPGGKREVEVIEVRWEPQEELPQR